MPLSATSWLVEFTADTALHDKLELAVSLSSHAVPSGDLVTVIGLALDHYIEAATRRRSGAGQPRKRRPLKPGSRHVPLDVARAVGERDARQCTFVDREGRRCSEKRFLTLEHVQPFALGGPPTVENLRLLCSSHNAHTARQVFGEEHIRKKIAEAAEKQKVRPHAEEPLRCDVDPAPNDHEKVLLALVHMGFPRSVARRALGEALLAGVEPVTEPLLRAALALLTPVTTPERRGAEAAS